MGLFFAEIAGPDFKVEEENAILHELGCNACPLANEPGDMPATGATEPLIYILGEAPGETEIDEGQQFVGRSGELLRSFIPREFIPEIRWNNVVRSHPPGNRDPERAEIEACRPSVIRDIEQSKPKAIFGFGNTPLYWISGFHGITSWRGRRMPVRVGSHTCWYYAFYHPAFLLYPTSTDEDKRVTSFDLERAFKEVDHLPTPVVHDAAKALSGIDCLTNVRQIEQALSWAARLPYVGVDYETNCLRPFDADAKILSASVATLDRAFAFPLEHPSSGFTAAQVAQVSNLWQRFLMHAPCRKVVHNLSFELEWSAVKFGPEVLRAQPWDDTATAASIIDERIGGRPKPGCFALEFLVQQYFGFNVKKVSNVDRTKLEHTPINEVLSYNAIDAKYHAGLWDELWSAIKHERLESVYELSLRRVPTVVLSQVLGAPVDQERARELQRKYDKLIKKTERAINDLDVMVEYEEKRGRAFNPYSVPETIYVFERLLHRAEIFVSDRFGNQSRSVKEEILERINHPLARHILALRFFSGTKSKYIDPLIEDDAKTVIFSDHLIHTNFNTYGSSAGRLSCSAPWTEVRTKRGTLQIKDVIPGDQVWTHRNRWQTVAAVWCKGVEQMFDIHLSNGKVLTCTKNHRVLSGAGHWVTVGDICDVFQRMDLSARERKASSGALSQQGSDFNCRDSKEIEHTREQYLRDHQTEHVAFRKAGSIFNSLFGIKTGSEKSDVWKIWRAASSLARRVLGRQGLLDCEDWATSYLCSSLPFYAGIGLDGAAIGLGCSPYRWRSSEQRDRQSGFGDKDWSCGYSLQATGDQGLAIEKIQASGSFEVFDLAVEVDASFETYGIFSHNSDSPNMQNFPKRDEQAKEVRSSIVAPPGCVCLSFDYGQIEARVAAMFTKDARFVKMLWDRYDIHGDWAKRIAYAYPDIVGGKKNFDDKAVMKKFRGDVKNQWTFPLIYGAKRSSVAGYLGIPEDVITPLYDAFWDEFSGILDWQRDQLKFYRRRGYVECLTGRRRHAPLTDNMIFNSPIQGTAAEIVMDAMCRLSETGDPELQPELQIHDDLTYLRVPTKRVDIIAEQVIEHMIAVPFGWINVPIQVEMSVGPDWEAMEEIGVYASDTWKKAGSYM